MNETKIISTVFNLMKIIEKKDNIDSKKDELYKNLEIIMGKEDFEKNKEIISFICETVIYISLCYKISINTDKFKNICCI